MRLVGKGLLVAACAGTLAVGCAGELRPERSAALKAPLVESRIRVLPVDPLTPTQGLVSLCRSENDTLVEKVRHVHSLFRIGGSLGIRYRKRPLEEKNFRPRTAGEVLKAREGDCSELTYLMLSGLIAAGLGRRGDVRIGALFGPEKEESPRTWHMVPIILIRDIPDALNPGNQRNSIIFDYSHHLFETSMKFRYSVLNAFGITKNTREWSMLIVDPERELNTQLPICCLRLPLDMDGVRAHYYYEIGVKNLLEGHGIKALEALETAVMLNDKDAFSHQFLGIIFEAFGMPDKADEHFLKAEQILGEWNAKTLPAGSIVMIRE